MPAGDRVVYYAIGLTQQQLFKKFPGMQQKFMMKEFDEDDDNDIYFEVYSYIDKIQTLMEMNNIECKLKLYNDEYYAEHTIEEDSNDIIFLCGFELCRYEIFENVDFELPSVALQTRANKIKEFFGVENNAKIYCCYDGDR
jgi:hypothetical protein